MKAKQAIKCNKNFFNQCPEEKQITQLLTQYCINTPVKFSLVCDMPPSYEEWGEWKLAVLMAELGTSQLLMGHLIPVLHSKRIPFRGWEVKEKNEPLFPSNISASDFSLTPRCKSLHLISPSTLPFQQSALPRRVIYFSLGMPFQARLLVSNTD